MNEPVPRVLVVDDEQDLGDLLVAFLVDFDVVHVVDVPSAREALRNHHIDLIVLDLMLPGSDGLDLLRHRPESRDIPPVIILSARHDLATKLEGFRVGADDYVTKPFEPAELVARIDLALRRRAALLEMRDTSPLTGMPGNAAIAGELEARCRPGHPSFALIHADLDNFKAYNDRYGFTEGDEAITATAGAVRQATADMPGAFVGHVGGDDFAIICDADSVDTMSRRLIATFDALVPGLHDEQDLARGFILIPDRRGVPQAHPLLSISLGAVVVAAGRCPRPSEVAARAVETKAVAKQQPSSAYHIDRRAL